MYVCVEPLDFWRRRGGKWGAPTLISRKHAACKIIEDVEEEVNLDSPPTGRVPFTPRSQPSSCLANKKYTSTKKGGAMCTTFIIVKEEKVFTPPQRLSRTIIITPSVHRNTHHLLHYWQEYMLFHFLKTWKHHVVAQTVCGVFFLLLLMTKKCLINL